MSCGTVCAPGQRYHPAVIAQAVATLCEMYPERFWLAVGSGENLNEHITGADWPTKEFRHQRLEESVAVMRDFLGRSSITVSVREESAEPEEPSARVCRWYVIGTPAAVPCSRGMNCSHQFITRSDFEKKRCPPISIRLPL